LGEIKRNWAMTETSCSRQGEKHKRSLGTDLFFLRMKGKLAKRKGIKRSLMETKEAVGHTFLESLRHSGNF